MLTFASTTRIFAYVRPTDMRKGVAGLSAIVRGEFQADPTDGSLFLFINQRRDRMKLLHFVDDSFWIHYRLLEAGTFETLRPRVQGACQLQMDTTELSMLIAGVSLAQSVRRRKRFLVKRARIDPDREPKETETISSKTGSVVLLAGR